MGEFLAADAPCFALGMVEERKRRCGFLALRPEEAIPPDVTSAGFSFGHCLFGNAAFEVVQFSFHFYGFKTYNVLVNPNQHDRANGADHHDRERRLLHFALGADEHATAFRSEIGETNLCGLETNLPRIRRSTTTEAQYRQAISSFAKHPQPPGVLLHWVCRDNVACLDLADDRLEMTPAPSSMLQMIAWGGRLSSTQPQ